MTQEQVSKQEFPCDLCEEPVEITFAEGANADCIKEMKKMHSHCANGMNEDGTLKPIGQWLDEIKLFHQRKDQEKSNIGKEAGL